MSAGNQNISVNFKVGGGELAAYIDNIQKKSDKLTNDAIRGAIEQSEKGKEQLKIINEQITAIERRNRVENEASRSVAYESKERALRSNASNYDTQRESIYGNSGLTEAQKREKITALDGSQKSGEDKIKSDYRDYIASVKEQERQSKLQTQLTKESIGVAKEAARENIKAIVNGDKTLADVYKQVGKDGSEEEKLTLRLIEEGLPKEKRGKGSTSGGGGAGVFSSMLGVDNIHKFIASATQFTQTKNGFDLIQPASNIAGQVIGGALGAIVGGLLSGGAAAGGGAAIGASLGGALGEGLGALKTREAMSKEEFLKRRNRYRAITGQEIAGSSMSNMDEYGVDASQFMGMQSDYARRRGTAKGSSETTRQAILLEKGYGVDQETSANIAEMQRSSKEGDRNLAELIGGVLAKGQGGIFKNGDNTFLNEFLGKFTTLQKELLKTQSTVVSGTTMDILSRFNKLGGEFDAKDSRSMSNISAIQNALSNPGADNLKAMSFSVLRRQNPNAGIFDLMEERQKGLGSSGYLKGMLGMTDQLGGDDQSKMMQLSGMFPGLSMSAVRRLYNKREGLMNGSTSMEELKNKFPADFEKKASDNTTWLEKNTAKIENGILTGNAIEEMSKAFIKAVESMLGSAVITMKDGNTIQINGGDGRSPLMHNKMKGGANTGRSMGLNDDNSLNMQSSLNKY